MTEPSQYFKGRTVQEQMNEVIGYVDVRAEEVAAAKADDVLEPAEQAKDDAIAAKEAAEQARDTTLAALPAVNERINDVESDLNAVTLRVTTAEGDIVTIQGRVTALETADGQNVKINRINDYAVGLTGNQAKSGTMEFYNEVTVNQFVRSIHVQKNGYSIDRSLGSWLPIYHINIGSNLGPQATFFMTFRKGGLAIVQYTQWNGTPSLNGILTGNTRTKENLVRASREGETVTIWVWISNEEGIRADCIGSYGTNNKAYLVTAIDSSKSYSISETGYTDENGIEHVFDSYVVFA